MKNKILSSVLFACVLTSLLTSCQSKSTQPYPAEENVADKPFEKPIPVKEEFDKDWPLQFATPLNDDAIHKSAVNALRKTKFTNNKSVERFCMRPNIQCYLDRISFPNEKTKRSASSTKLIHRERFTLNKKELAVFGYEKDKSSY